jgi:hypothetical protein
VSDSELRKKVMEQRSINSSNPEMKRSLKEDQNQVATEKQDWHI